jgi:hypothetical protein
MGFVKRRGYTLAVRVARYKASSFATDTTRAFLTLDWAL